MSVIIRLQNLPWSANATDIRQFFKGLGIPDGGVHIVGGENGDAFIAFSTDDDARKAMRLDGGKLKEIQVRLFLSSRAEMQEVIERARQTTLSLMQMQRHQIQPSTPQSPPLQATQPQINPMMPATSLSGILTQQMFQQSQMPAMKESKDVTNANKKRRSRSSRSRSRSRERDRYRRRSRSPRSRNRGRSHRDRSSSRERDRRNRNGTRSDKDNDKRPSDVEPTSLTPANPTANVIHPQLYPQNNAFNSNVQPFLMNKPIMPVNNAIDANMLNMAQGAHLGAFSTNDVRTMNMNMNMATANNPLAFQQMYNPQANLTPFNNFQPGVGLNNAQQLNPLLAPQMNYNFSNDNVKALPSTTNNQNLNMKQYHCVKLRNLCNQVNYSGIRKFFNGLVIPNDGIKIIHDKDGNRTGIAYVRFVRPLAVAQAIHRGNQKLGRTTVQIQELEDKIFDDAIDAYRPRRHHGRNDRDRERDRDRDNNRDRDFRGRRNYRRGSDSNDDIDDDNDRDSRSKSSDKDDGDNDVMCISDSNDSKELAPYTTVLIEDLPPFTKEQDIMKMFSSYPLVHIVMAKRPKMFSSYVKFHSADDARAAVKNIASHKISFKTVYLSACSEEEYETARKEFSGDLDIDGSKPPESSSSESKDELKSPDFTPNSINNEIESDSFTNMPKISLEGIPGINLADPRINALKLQQSLQIADKPFNERVDPRTGNVVQPNIENSMITNGHYNNQFGNIDLGVEMPVCCVFIENMEYRTIEPEIIDWMHSINLVPVKIQMLVNSRNQTNGECFVQFATNAEASKALTLHQSKFKSRTVRVCLAPWQKIQETLTDMHSQLRINNSGGPKQSNFGNNSRGNNFGNNNNNNSSSNNNNSNNSFFNGPNGRSNNNQRFPQRGNNNSMPLNNNLDGCIVSLANVPYKAGMEDIMDFFGDFNIHPDDIMRRFNEEGKPTGDARVRFNSPAEARRAAEQMDSRRIMTRPIRLTIL